MSLSRTHAHHSARPTTFLLLLLLTLLLAALLLLPGVATAAGHGAGAEAQGRVASASPTAAFEPTTADPLALLAVQQAELRGPDVTGVQFGYSVAISGDTALVGAPYADVGTSYYDQGAAYVYVRSGASWSLQQELTAPDAFDLAAFGQSVALDGDTALVGAPEMPNGGAAYIFVRSGTTWTFQKELTAPDAPSADAFGESVALSGDNAVVGNPDNTVGGQVMAGSAYFFARSGTAWSFQTEVLGSGAWDEFGTSVALSGDTALVGAPYSYTAAWHAGAAYVCVLTGSDWTQHETELTAADGAASAFFGTSVALSGDAALVGADEYASLLFSAGAAYVYVPSGTGWSQEDEFRDPSAATDNGFGFTVGLSGDTALVGAPGEPFGASTQVGAAFVMMPFVPANTTAPQISGSAALNGTLTCASGTWTGYPTPTYGYQWLRDGAAISGATGASHAVQAADLGHNLACTVTASNSQGQATAKSNTVKVAEPISITSPTATSSWVSSSSHSVTWTMNPAVSGGEFRVWLVSSSGHWYVGKQVLPTSGKTSYSTQLTASVPAGSYKAYVCWRPTVGTGSWAATSKSAAFAVTPLLPAGWSVQSSDTGATLDDVACAGASHAWAVGYAYDAATEVSNGVILATSDGGAPWSAQGSATVIANTQLQSVACANASDVWTVGWNGTILATTNGGASWTAQDSKTSSYLFDIACANASDAWAVGQGGTILATTNGGATWSKQISGSTANLSGVAFVSVSEGWTVGANGTILATTNGGATWAKQSSGTTATLWSTAFTNASDGWTVGANGTILATTSGGASWKAQYAGTAEGLGGLACTSASDAWAVGDGGSILATTNGGVPAPELKSFTPPSGAVGCTVTLTGTGLTGASKVTFNGVNAKFTVNSDTQIAATVPSGAMSGKIAVTTVGGVATSATSFTIIAAPQITSFSPTSGTVGVSVSLSGTGFTGATKVAFDGTSASFSVVSDTQITATVPAGAMSGPLSVTNPAGKATSAASFTVMVTPTLTLKLSGLKIGAIKLGKRLTAKAKVTPASLAGSKVTLTVQRKQGSKWRRVRSLTRTIASSGTYSCKYKPAKKGSYRIEAWMAQTATNTAATTKWLKFKVK